jgi:hypothetical protein
MQNLEILQKYAEILEKERMNETAPLLPRSPMTRYVKFICCYMHSFLFCYVLK